MMSPMLPQLLDLFHSGAAQALIYVPLGLILLDLLSGLLRAVLNKSFRLAMVGDFLHSNLLPYLGVMLSLVGIPLLTGMPLNVVVAGATAALAAFCAAQIGSIAENLGGITGYPNATLGTFVSAAFRRVFPGGANEIPAVPVTPTSPTTPMAPEGPAPTSAEAPQMASTAPATAPTPPPSTPAA